MMRKSALHLVHHKEETLTSIWSLNFIGETNYIYGIVNWIVKESVIHKMFHLFRDWKYWIKKWYLHIMVEVVLWLMILKL